MGRRILLHKLLVETLGSDNVYFQPPSDFKMIYPCIVYQKELIHSSSADNRPYKIENRYSLTVIDLDPDSLIPQKVSELPRCISNRHFVADNLHHDSFSIIF